MKTISNVFKTALALAVKLDQSFLSKFMIGRKIAGVFKNKIHRYIFLTLWFGKTIVFYWIVL